MAGQNVWAVFAAATVVLPLLHTPMAAASTIREVEMTCPYDGTKFKATLQGSGTSFGTALDLMPVGPIISPWPLAECPTNGFVFLQDKYTEEELERLRPLVLSDAYQALKAEAPYYRAYWLRQKMGASPEQASFTLLQATWQVARSPEKYARYAGELLARLPDDIRAEENKEKAITLRMLQGELLRRLRRFDEAKEYFEHLQSEFPPESDAALIVKYQIGLCDWGNSAPQQARSAIQEAEKDVDIWWRRNAPEVSNPTFKVGVRLHGTLLYGGQPIWGPDGQRLYWNAPPLMFKGEGQLLAIDPLDVDAKPVSLPWPMSRQLRQKLGSVVVSGDTDRLIAYDTHTDQQRELPRPALPGTAFCRARDTASPLRAQSPTSPIVALACGRDVLAWNYQDGKVAFQTQFTSVNGVAVEFSADGDHLLIAAPSKDAGIELAMWSMTDSRKVAQHQTKGYKAQIIVNGNPRYIGLLHGNELTVLDSSLSSVVVTIRQKGGISSAAFSPDGQYLAVAFGQDTSLVIYAIEP